MRIKFHLVDEEFCELKVTVVSENVEVATKLINEIYNPYKIISIQGSEFIYTDTDTIRSQSDYSEELLLIKEKLGIIEGTKIDIYKDIDNGDIAIYIYDSITEKSFKMIISEEELDLLDFETLPWFVAESFYKWRAKNILAKKNSYKYKQKLNSMYGLFGGLR